MKQNNYGAALSMAEKDIKYITKKDNKFRCIALLARAEINKRLGQKDKVISDLNQAIKEDPQNYDNYIERAQFLYEEKQYELANKDYHQMITIAPGKMYAHMGIGRNFQIQEEYQLSIEQYNYVVKLNPEYSHGYSFRADSYFYLEKYSEAADDIIKAHSTGFNERAFYTMLNLADSAFLTLKKKIEIQDIKDPSNENWKYFLGIIHERKHYYKKAIEYFKESALMEPSSVTYYRISNCYEYIGDFDAAMSNIDQAIKLDSTDYDYIQHKAYLLYQTSRPKEAIALFDKFINYNPEYYESYYRRGLIKDYTNDIEGAIDDYSTVILLQPDFTYAYLGRGDKYKKLGKNDLAKKDYNKVIAPDASSCAFYAFLALGEIDKAKSFMNKVIEQDPEDSRTYYDAT